MVCLSIPTLGFSHFYYSFRRKLGSLLHGDVSVMLYKPRHDKTNKMSVRPAKTQISLVIRPVWSVFVVRMKKPWALNYPLSAQRRLWSDWADDQADLSLRWAHSHCVGFVVSWLIWSYTARYCLCLVLQSIRRASQLCSTIIIHKNWAPSSEFVSSSILSWQILTAHAQPFSGARDMAFCLKVPLDSLPVWSSSGDSGRLSGCAGSPEPSLLA